VITRSRLDDEGGMTLLELVVAMSILSFVLLAFGSAMGSSLTVVRNNRERIVAANLAAQEMERVRSSAFASLPLGRSDVVETINGQAYTVQRDITWQDQSAGTGPCDSPTSTEDLLLIEVSVSWTGMGVVAPVESSTVLTPSAGAFDPTKGNIAVQVLGASGAPAAGDTVTITPSGQTQFTPASGCAFFRQLNPGSYTITLSRPGYVDGEGNPTPHQVAGVVANEQVGVPFEFDAASTVAATIAGPAGAWVPPDLTVHAGSTGLALGSRSFPGTGTTRSLTSLFPFKGGYELWAGPCLDSDPEGVTDPNDPQPFWPGAQRAELVAVTPGASTTATIVLPAVDLIVTDGAGQPEGGGTVVAYRAADAACPGGAVLDAGTVDAAGHALIALPYGRWTLAVSGVSSSGWPAVTLDPTQPSPISAVAG
jgi:type II secretory pathway pseudopilin PulG